MLEKRMVSYVLLINTAMHGVVGPFYKRIQRALRGSVQGMSVPHA